MKIVFGCDPNAAEFKEELMEYVKELGHQVTDFGSEDPVYANVAIKCAQAVAAKEFDRGIVVCGTGIGVSIAANKVHMQPAFTMCTRPGGQSFPIMPILLPWDLRWWASSLQN